MSMSVGPGAGGGEELCDINTTPLIDVMLVLLIMLILTLPIMTHAVKLDMPNANNRPPPEQRPEVIDLEVDFDGAIVWNGTVVKDIPTLEGFFKTESEKIPQPEIHLRPNARAKYDVVAKVLAAAQHNRMQKIGFVNVGQFSQ